MPAIPKTNHQATCIQPAACIRSAATTVANGVIKTAAVISSFALSTLLLPFLFVRSVVDGVRSAFHKNKTFSDGLIGSVVFAIISPPMVIWMTYKNTCSSAYKEGFTGTYESIRLAIHSLLSSRCWVKITWKK